MVLSQFYSHFLFLVSHYRVVIKSIFGLLWCVDPDQCCAVMLIHGTHIVVLLFRQEGALEEHEQEGTFTARYDINDLIFVTIYPKSITELALKMCRWV